MTTKDDIEKLAEQLMNSPSMQPFVEQLKAEIAKLSPAELAAKQKAMQEIYDDFEDAFEIKTETPDKGT